MKKKLTIILGILAFFVVAIVYIVYQWMGIGGGGINQAVPDTVMAGQSTTLHLYVSLTGGSASQNIDKAYPAATLFYRLSGESEYQSVIGRKVSLPSNYQAVISEGLKYKAFEFVIPPYPLNTIGKVEYYFELQTPGNPNGVTFRVEGIKNITVETLDPLRNIDRPSLEIIE